MVGLINDSTMKKLIFSILALQLLFAFFSLTRPSFFTAGVSVFTLGLRVNVWNKKAPCTGDGANGA